MKKSEALDLFTPQRQSEYAIFIILLKFVRMLIRQLWPVLLILLFNRKGSLDLWLSTVIGALAAFSLVASIISYYKFYFHITDGHLNIERGVLRRTKLNIPFERIQTINFEQNIIHQFFNVVSVKIDTAGTKGNETSFDALDKERANLLREYILSQKSTETGIAAAEAITREEEKQLILHLTAKDLLKIGISQNHFRTAGIILVFFYGILENLENALDMNVFDRVNDEVGAMITTSLILVLIAIPVFLFISFLITLIRTVIQYFDLRFWKTRNGFKLVSGLFTRKEKSAQRHKIQIINWSTNPIRKIFGIFTLRLYQASSAEVIGDKSISVPGVYQHQLDQTIRDVMPGVADASFEEHGIDPLARLRIILIFGLIPPVIFSLIAYFADSPRLYGFWLLLPLVVVLAQLYFKKRKILLHPDFLQSTGGLVGNTYKLVETFKVQSVAVSQRFHQLRRGLANIHIYTASGEIRVPYLPLDKAMAIHDYVLYRIESDQSDWM